MQLALVYGMEAVCGYCPVFVGVLRIVKRSQLTSGKLGLILECPASSRVSGVTHSTQAAAEWSGRNGLKVHDSHPGKMGVTSFICWFIHSLVHSFILHTVYFLDTPEQEQRQSTA